VNLLEYTERVIIIDLRLRCGVKFEFQIMANKKTKAEKITGAISSLGVHEKFSLEAILDI
jgi:hypothetical protein